MRSHLNHDLRSPGDAQDRLGAGSGLIEPRASPKLNGRDSENQLEYSGILYQELSNSLKVDKQNLDECLLQQPELYHKAGREYENACAFRDDAKVERDQCKAEFDFKIRQEAEKLQTKPKPTEAAITNLINAEPKYQSYQEVYHHWERMASRWFKLREDFHARGFTLQQLAQLWIAGYFQTNSVSSSQRDLRDERSDQVRQGRREVLRRRNED